MATPGVINQVPINTTVTNGSTHILVVDASVIVINVNKAVSALINYNTINSIIINGLITSDNVALLQTHILSVDDSVMSVVSTSPVPVLTHLLKVNSASISVSANKVFIEKGQGGSIFITVTEPDTTTHRFSFDGVKA